MFSRAADFDDDEPDQKVVYSKGELRPLSVDPDEK
jgi:hypothetical protein